MATIVQPYNPWREQLALTALGNVAGNILGDLWQTHKQNEQNRKANAFRGALSEKLRNMAQQADITLAQPEAPQGYNSNPWAAAFHQKYAPLTQFDIGTSQRQPTLQDIAQNADTLAASERFSKLGQDTVNSIRDSMMRQTIGNMFGNAGDVEGRMNALTLGAANGLVAPQVLAAYSPFARDVLSPYTFQESDLGQNKVISALNRITGMATPGMVMPVSVSPNTAANNATSRYVADRSAESSRYASDTQRYGYDSTSQWRNRELEDEERQREYDRNNPQLTPHTDKFGNVRGLNTRTGEGIIFRDEDHQPIMDNPPPKDLGERDRAALKSLETKREELIKRFNSIALWREPNEPPSAEEQSIYAQIEECNKEIDKIINPPAPKPAQNTLGTFMASADVQPVQTTQSTSQTPIRAMGASSPDVRPQAPVSAPTPTQQNFSDFNPSYIDMSNLQGVTGQSTPTRNPSADLRAVAQTPPPASTAPAKQAQPRKGESRISVPSSVWYNPNTHKNVPRDLIATPQEFARIVDYYLSLPQNKDKTPQEVANALFVRGIKIKEQK